MALSPMQRMVLTAIGVGIVVGVVIGALGAYLGLSAGVRGGITGALIVVLFQYMRRKMNQGQRPEAGQS